MTVELLRDTPPWEWPRNARETLLAALNDRSRPEAERATAAALAGDMIVVDDAVALQLASLVRSPEEPEEVRAAAASALGPVLEQTDIEGFDDDGISEPPIAETTFHTIQETLRAVHDDPGAPKLARRRALEGSVRAPQEWHGEAIRKDYDDGDPEWRMTALFGMQYVRGFDKEILSSLEDPNEEIRFEAVRAAGGSEVAAAWPHIEPLLTSPETDKDLRLAAIEAAPGVGGEKAVDALADLCSSPDEDIADAAMEAMSFVENGDFDDDEEDDDEN